jgi:hypothetical protein
VLPSKSEIIAWIEKESKKEHIGPSPWKKASKWTLNRIFSARGAQWGQTKKVTAKPLYRAVAHVSFRNFLCNAACLHHVHNPLSPHNAALSNTDQFKIVLTNAGFEILFFDRSEAAVLAAAHRSLASTGKTGVPSYVVVTGMLTLLASGCWQLILMLKGKEFKPDATGKSRRIMKVC